MAGKRRRYRTADKIVIQKQNDGVVKKNISQGTRSDSISYSNQVNNEFNLKNNPNKNYSDRNIKADVNSKKRKRQDIGNDQSENKYSLGSYTNRNNQSDSMIPNEYDAERYDPGNNDSSDVNPNAPMYGENQLSDFDSNDILYTPTPEQDSFIKNDNNQDYTDITQQRYESSFRLDSGSENDINNSNGAKKSKYSTKKEYKNTDLRTNKTNSRAYKKKFKKDRKAVSLNQFIKTTENKESFLSPNDDNGSMVNEKIPVQSKNDVDIDLNLTQRRSDGKYSQRLINKSKASARYEKESKLKFESDNMDAKEKANKKIPVQSKNDIDIDLNLTQQRSDGKYSQRRVNKSKASARYEKESKLKFESDNMDVKEKANGKIPAQSRKNDIDIDLNLTQQRSDGKYSQRLVNKSKAPARYEKESKLKFESGNMDAKENSSSVNSLKHDSNTAIKRAIYTSTDNISSRSSSSDPISKKKLQKKTVSDRARNEFNSKLRLGDLPDQTDKKEINKLKTVESLEKKADKIDLKLAAKKQEINKKQESSNKLMPKSIKKINTTAVKMGGATLNTAKGKIITQAHDEVNKYEDNAGLKAAHEIEKVSERSTSKLVTKTKNVIMDKFDKQKQLENLTKKSKKANLKANRSRLKFEGATRKKAKPTLKAIQKKYNKKLYAKMYRESLKTKTNIRVTKEMAAKIFRTLKKIVLRTTQKAMYIAKFLVANAQSIAIVAGVLIILIGLVYAVNLGILIITESVTGVTGTTITADDTEIASSTSYWTELEEELKKKIAETEIDHPGYDEYYYYIDDISQDPFAIIAFLSAMYKDFLAVDVNPILAIVFNEKYTYSTRDYFETRIEYDDDGTSHTRTVHIFETTVTAKPFDEVVRPILEANNCFGLYKAYIDSKGNRQGFGSPVGFDWYEFVGSYYGYRRVIPKIDDTRTEAELRVIEFHGGLDIQASEDTPIRCVSTGTVIETQYTEEFSHTITVLDNYGYVQKYGHLKEIYYHAGENVVFGDIVGLVDKVEDELGARLHIEILYNDESLNPLFLLQTGRGYIVDITDIPSEAFSGENFQKIMDEATQYIGRAYVWGGSTPATGFDCSGFVRWAYNKSLELNLPRTAQGQFDVSTVVSNSEVKPGDLVFFAGTYDSERTVTHVGIYVGGDQMLHCGDPIGYANLSNPYWVSHFYAFGRVTN